MRLLKAAIWRWFKVAMWLFAISVILSAAVMFGLAPAVSSAGEVAGMALMILLYAINLFLIGMLVALMFGFNVKARITPVLTPVVAGTIVESILTGPLLLAWGWAF